eukprot:9260214-Pyramimonas_sp.AAC.1
MEARVPGMSSGHLGSCDPYSGHASLRAASEARAGAWSRLLAPGPRELRAAPGQGRQEPGRAHGL